LAKEIKGVNMTEDYCTWEYNGEDVYSTSCDDYIEYSEDIGRYKHCPYCGGLIRYKTNNDED